MPQTGFQTSVFRQVLWCALTACESPYLSASLRATMSPEVIRAIVLEDGPWLMHGLWNELRASLRHLPGGGP